MLVGLAVGLAACGSGSSRDAANTASPTRQPIVADHMTIPRMLTTDDRFSTLRTALDSTGLDSVLATSGPFTLFAPPNEAFAALPPGSMETLLTDNQAQLRALLARHVVEQRVVVEGHSEPHSVVPMSGDTLSLRPASNPPTVEAISILDSDIEASNGRLHVVDTVLRPPASEEP